MTAATTPPPAAGLPPAGGGVSEAQQSRLKLESLLLTATYGLTALIGVAFWAVAARTVPARLLGESTAIISAFTAAAVVAATGVANAFLAMVPIAGAARGRLLRHGYTITCATSLVTGAVAGVVAAMTVPAIGTPFHTALTITVTSVVWGAFVIQDSVLVAFGKARWLLAENIPVSIVKLGTLPVFAAVFGERAQPAVIATVVPAAAAVMVVTGVVVPRLVRTTDADRIAAGTDTVTAEQWMVRHRREFRLFAVRDGAASAMNLGLFMFLPFLVTAAAGGVEGAVFALSLQISNAMDLFTAGVGITLTTTVASDHDAGPAAARMMWKRLARIVGGVAVLVVIGSPVLLWAFGSTYLHHNGWLVVVVLAAGSLLRTTFEVWTALLRALRRTGVLLAWTSVTSVTLFVAVVVGARSGGAVGAALGVALATVVSSTVGGLGLLGRIGNRRPGSPPRRTPRGGPLDTRVSWPWLGYEPAPMDGVTELATYFGDEQRARFGWISMPSSGRATQGVVLCPPVGEEARSAHRAFRRLGSELARRGVVALRVDYDGTGDSAGGQHDPDRVQAWQASILDAAGYLRARGLEDIGLIGMRMGATLGAGVAAEAGFRSVVLWDPCATGRGFLREGQALHALGEHAADPAADGEIHTPGFRYAANTVEALRAVGLASLPERPWCERLLVLTRNGAPLAGRAGAALAAQGAEWATADGQPELINVEPNQARTPMVTVEKIVDWFTREADPAGETPVVVAARTETVVQDPITGVDVRERIVELGPARLFGVVTEPLSPSPTDPWVMLPNVAIELHIGPGRCWVEFARSWAAMGMRCVRFDQSGLGDSPLRPGQNEDMIFDPRWLQDVPEVFDALRSGAAPVAALGLCSGAYTSFEAAMRRPFDALYALSPRITVPQMAIGEPSYSPARLAARPFVRPLARLFQRDTMAAWGLWRLYRQVAPWHSAMSSAMGLLRTGADLRILSDRKDAEAYREVLWWSVVRRPSVARTGRYRLTVHPDVDHALMTQSAQRLAFREVTAYWAERYGLRAPEAVVEEQDPVAVG